MAEANALFNVPPPANPLDQASKALGIAQQAQALDMSKFELGMKQLGVLRGVTSSFLADPDAGKTDITKKVQSEVSKLVGMGLYSPQQATTFLKTWPSNPNEQYKALIRIHAETLEASEQLGAIFGIPTDQNTGPGTLTTQRPAYPGLPIRERGFVRGGLPPTTQVPNRDTQQPEYLGTDEAPAVEQRPGSLTQVPGGRPVRPGSIAPVAPPPSPATSAAPIAPRPPAQTAETPAAPTPGRTPAAFPMGAAEASGVAAKGLAEAREAAGNYQERVNPTRNVIELTSKIKDSDVGAIGPGSETFNRLKSAIQTWGMGEIAGIDPQKVADHNKLKKYMADAASRRAQGLGPHTNEGLAAAVAASPNMKLDKLSANELAKVNLALDRMHQATVLEFDSMRRPEGTWSTWKANFATQQDPRAFVWDLLSKAQQDKLEATLKTEAQRKRFERSLALADKHGLLGDVNAD